MKNTHLSLAELLSLRDGEPLAIGKSHHFEHCPHCQSERTELDRVQIELNQLPTPPPSLSTKTKALHQWRKSNRGLFYSPLLTLAAATLLLSLTLLVPQRTLAPSVSSSPKLTKQASRENLISQSQTLETQLLTLRQQSRVRSGWESTLTLTLEDRVANLDKALASGRFQGKALNTLWRSRIDTLRKMVHLEEGELEKPSFESL